MSNRPRPLLDRFTLWQKDRAPQTPSTARAATPETTTPIPQEPDRPRTAARFVLLQCALHDDGTLRETLETITRQGDTGRPQLARMLGQASRAVAQYPQAALPIHFTRTGDQLDVNLRIVNLHGLLLAMQNTPEDTGDVLIVTLAATLTERRSAPTNLPDLLSNIPEDALLRAQISWSPATGPLQTARHARRELAALDAHLQE